MCLAVFAVEQHPEWPLIVVANRDEFHARPTKAMHPWPESFDVLAGRDLQGGGTWLGIDTRARLALLTNVRDPKNNKTGAPSRGRLAEMFLFGGANAKDYLEEVAVHADDYNGFNLIVIDETRTVWHASNYQTPFYQRIEPGVHGLSNALMNTAWPKTEATRNALATCLANCSTPDPDALGAIMLDTTPVDDALLPNTGLSMARERLLATPFILSADYGTRCTTIVMRHRSGSCWVQEDSFNPQGERTKRLRWWLSAGQTWQPTQTAPTP